MKALAFTLAAVAMTANSAMVPIELAINTGVYSDRRGTVVIEFQPDNQRTAPKKWTIKDTLRARPKRMYHRILIEDSLLFGSSTNFVAWMDYDGDGMYDPGEPFGCSALRDIPEIELTETSAVTPRINLWDADISSASDRARLFGVNSLSCLSNKITDVSSAQRALVGIARYEIDEYKISTVGVPQRMVMKKLCDRNYMYYIHDGFFLGGQDFDIDWGSLYDEALSKDSPSMTWIAKCECTNMNYIAVFNMGQIGDSIDTNTVIASQTLISRRFERTRSIPVPVSSKVRRFGDSSTCTFKFRIENEEAWASMYGTTYTSFKINVYNDDDNVVITTGIKRLPAADESGNYAYSVRLPDGVWDHLKWRAAVYNAKFKTDDFYQMSDSRLYNDVDKVFSPATDIKF